MADTFSINFACLQISSFEKVILYSFWDIPPVKIGKHAQVKHFPNPSAKHARLPQIKTVKPPDKKPGISDRSSFLRRRSVWQNCVTTFPRPGCFKSMLTYVIHPQNTKNPSCVWHCAMKAYVL